MALSNTYKKAETITEKETKGDKKQEKDKEKEQRKRKTRRTERQGGDDVKKIQINRRIGREKCYVTNK